MNEKNKKTILEEAVIEMKTILEAAEKNAKDKIAKELPEKFEKIFSEQLNKLQNKEPVNESKNVDDKKEESDQDKKTTGKEEEPLNEVEDIDMRELSIDDVKEAYDEANPDDDFEVELSIDDIANEIDQMDEMHNEMVSDNEEKEDTNNPYGKIKKVYEMMTEMIKEMDDEKMHNEMHEAFNSKMTEMYGEGYKDNLGEEKFNELYEMFVARQKGDPYEKQASVNEEKNTDEMKKVGGLSSVEQNAGNTDKSGGPTPEKIQEEDDHESDDNREEEEKVDEIHGQSYSAGKVRSGTLPNTGAEYRDRPGHSRNRAQWSNLRKENWEKRMKSLIEENKKLTKENNDNNQKYSKLKDLNENYINVLEKYRNQLQEMAIANTNIAYVNDILIKESDSTLEEKQNIINKFKNVKSITESENVYKSIISEMNNNDKQNLDESIEQKISNTVGQSSKQIVEQVVEKTALGKTHLDEIKRRMNYVLSANKK